MRVEVRENAWSRLATGIVILVAGVIFWLDQIDRLDARDYVDWWPLALVAIGLAHLPERRWAGGLIWIAIGGFRFQPAELGKLATVLALASHEGYRCHALSFDYEQRHRKELDCARAVAEALGVPASSLSFHLAQLTNAGLIAQRREKLQALRAQGGAFPNDFRRDLLAADLHTRWTGDEAMCHELAELQQAFSREWLCYRSDPEAKADFAAYAEAELAAGEVAIRFKRLNKLSKLQPNWTFYSPEFERPVLKCLVKHWPLEYQRDDLTMEI